MNTKIFGSILLIAGTAIGAGMLGLPLATQSLGFFTALAVFIACWAIMTYSALLLGEVSFHLKKEGNLLSMVNARLGPVAGYITQFTYLVFFYSLLASYSAGTCSLLSVTGSWAQYVVPGLFISYFFILNFGPKYIDLFNRILMIGLFASYSGLVMYVGERTPPLYLTQWHWSMLPVIALSFGFHHLVPSIRDYVGNPKDLKKAIILGSIVPLVVYILWEYIALGAEKAGGDLSLMLSGVANINLPLGKLVWAFSIFSLLSSFVGVTFGLFDFLRDSISWKNRLPFTMLTLFPPAIYAYLYPQGFMSALQYAGSFAGFLLIVIPAMLAITYRKGWGRMLPILLAGFGFVVMVV